VLTGKEVPASKRSTELGVQCFNVATVYTAYRALAHGEPVISRIVTLTGNVEQPRNWEVRSARRCATGRPRAAEGRHRPLPDGRPDDGLRDADLDAPVVKATNCIIAGSPALFPPSRRRCRASAAAPAPRSARTSCSRSRLYWFSRAKELRQDAGVSHLRLHRMRLLQLRLPVAHSAGAVFPLRQERNLGARARKEGGRRRQGALRAAQRARRAREGREGRALAKGAAAQASEEGAEARATAAPRSAQPAPPSRRASRLPIRRRSTPKPPRRPPSPRPWNAPAPSAKPQPKNTDRTTDAAAEGDRRRRGAPGGRPRHRRPPSRPDAAAAEPKPANDGLRRRPTCWPTPACAA
jgi:electron transport complex protein RnfC